MRCAAARDYEAARSQPARRNNSADAAQMRCWAQRSAERDGTHEEHQRQLKRGIDTTTMITTTRIAVAVLAESEAAEDA